ncbi:ABC transporter substrate-binding protein [Hydrogenophaga sp.]|uniref:ABC transporter substrate-binding protein n=1 Tax=Hydrogenophaga sp. TaxID=1904254 RepID=UPI00261864E2|nr:ABC transporter substrate-binding protein [Hydrogenophaga sp.]MCW5654696.1 ABC transporter substrate-binding protein [Hydrogenophaga sp.]
MWSRRHWGRAFALGALATALPPLRAQGASAPAARVAAARQVIAAYDRASFCYLPLTIAERLGFFAQEGLDVDVREFADAQQATQAVLGGAAQVLSASYSSAISLQARGQSFQSFVLQGRAPQVVLGISIKTMGHFRELADLRGRRVGVVADGSASHRVASLVLGKAGLRPGEVQYVAQPSPALALQAFRRGQLDAISYTDPTVTELEQGGELRVVVDTRSTRGTAEVFGGPMPSGCLCAPVEFLTQQPKVSQAMADALVHALKWLQTAGPSDLIKAVPERYFHGDRALYLAAFARVREAWTVDGLMPEAGPATAARMLALFEEPESVRRVDLARTFTNDFARKAKARFRA